MATSAGVIARLIAGWTAWRGRRHPLVGLYGLPRGGTNFVSAALHYHPRVFCVSEREHDWRRPLERYWQRRSIFREHGVQDKELARIERVVFNKVQRFPRLWGAQVALPADTRLIFYLRNPIRVFRSREAYRREHEPFRDEWSATTANFEPLLDEAGAILSLHRQFAGRHACLFWTHEHFCLHYQQAVAETFRFIDVEDVALPEPRAFFRSCGRCGAPFTARCVERRVQLRCETCGVALRGYGHFDPLRPIDTGEVVNANWKTLPGVDKLMLRLRARLGSALADYFWAGDYSQELPLDTLRHAA
ncbi:MAG TPA: hypothetical protein VML55_01635 [Planctomycetaceae bacterium]|nr:hypothetical protein [Planctomycetaceae bacterium]